MKNNFWQQSQRGFSLLELLIAMSILAVLVAMAAPTFDDTMVGSNLREYSDEMVSGAVLARSEAIKRSRQVRMCAANADGDDCSGTTAWANGWLVFSDTNGDGTVDTGETIIQVKSAVNAGYNLTGSSNSIVFEADGVGSAYFTATICRSSPVGRQERSISVTGTGRAVVNKTYNGTCP